MDLSDYQRESRTTAQYPDLGNNTLYPALGLCGEAGEACEKVKKMIRDDGGRLTAERRELLLAELGDVLWYAAQLCTETNLVLAAVPRTHRDPAKTLAVAVLRLQSAAGRVADMTAAAAVAPKQPTDALLRALAAVISSLEELSELLGTTLPQLADANIAKLRDRQARAVLNGDGDIR